MVVWHMPLQAEAVEQRLLRHRPLAHHRPVSARLAKIKSDHRHHCKADFFNTIGPKQTKRHCDAMRGPFPVCCRRHRRAGRRWRPQDLAVLATFAYAARDSGV